MTQFLNDASFETEKNVIAVKALWNFIELECTNQTVIRMADERA